MSSVGLSPLETERWIKKWHNLRGDAAKKGCACPLSFEEYIRLAVNAGLTSPDQIGRSIDSYQLGRLQDSGDYSVDNCRFITMRQNLDERTINGGAANISKNMMKPKTEEHRRRIGEGQKGKVNSEEARAKMKEAWKRRKEKALAVS